MGRPESLIRRAATEISKVRGVTVYGALQWPSGAKCAPMTFGSNATWDSDSFYAPGQPTRITIPTNLAGRYLARATVVWSRGSSQPFTLAQRDGSSYPSGYFTAVIVANNTVPSPKENLSVAAVVANAMKTSQSVSWETDLAVGDYLEVQLCQYVIGVDTSLPPASDTLIAEATLTVRRLGLSA